MGQGHSHGGGIEGGGTAQVNAREFSDQGCAHGGVSAVLSQCGGECRGESQPASGDVGIEVEVSQGLIRGGETRGGW